MIYQCYFRPEHQSRLFNTSLYRGFGLEPEVNPTIATHCPELALPANRLQLVDFAAMLHLWRNPPDDGDSWIGFTSYRQLDKVDLTWNSKDQIESLLTHHDVLHWGRLDLGDSLANQAESCHPGIMRFISNALREFGEPLPTCFVTETAGFYIDYWIMRKELFRDHMSWLYRFIEYGFRRQHDDAYLLSHPKALAYALERLFIVWYCNTQRTIYDARAGGTFLANQRIASKRPRRTIHIACPANAESAIPKVSRAISEGKLSHGEHIQEFEQALARYVGRRAAIVTSSGSMADVIALAATAELTGKKRVIVPALTFVAQANAALQANLELIFCDVGPDFLLDMERATHLADSMNAIICTTDLLGRLAVPAPGYTVIEDACEAFGSSRDGIQAGNNGAAGTFSFFVTHTLGIGEGGAIVTDDIELEQMCRSMRDHGRSGTFSFPWKGFNGKMTNVLAAIGCAALEEIDQIVTVRRGVYKRLERRLFQFPEKDNEMLIPHGYPIRFESRVARDSALRTLADCGVECRPLFSCLPTSEHFHTGGSFPNAEDIAAKYLYTPCHHLMSADDCDHVVDCVIDLWRTSTGTSFVETSADRPIKAAPPMNQRLTPHSVH